MLPVIAIFGRANVGKSTLFNALTQTRSALVVDLPGTTRDRQYGTGIIGDTPYTLIDTGGVASDVKIDQQTWQAVAEADEVLFVVDAGVGITDHDLRLARQLRKLNKAVKLVLNKVDGIDLNSVLADFYALGFGEPIPISAREKRGLVQLTDTFLANHSAEDNAQEDEKEDGLDQTTGIKVAVIGQPNVGKSTLVNRILGEQRVIVADFAGTTTDSIYIPFERDQQSYTLIDTAGVRRRAKIKQNIEKFSVVKSLQAIDDCHVVLFVIDAKKGLTDQDLSLLNYTVDAGRALVLVVNKWDGLPEDEKQEIKRALGYRLQFVDYAVHHYISALHGSGVGNIFASIKQAYHSATKPLSTPLLTDLLAEITSTHQLPLVNGRRIKLRYAHSGGHNPQRIIIHGNQTDKIPSSYVRYMQKTFTSKLNLVGTPLMLEFITGNNPYAGKRNVLTPRQLKKRERLQRYVRGKG